MTEFLPNDVEAEIIAYLRMVIFDAAVLIERDTDLLAAGLDSIALLNLLLFLEKRYGVCIPDESITEEVIRTVKTFAALVCSLMTPDCVAHT